MALDIVLVAVLMAVAWFFFLKFLSWPIWVSIDQEAFIWQGWNILRHEVPYRDFLEMKPLMIMLMNALGLAWLGLKDFRWLPFFTVCLSQVLFFISMRRMRVHPVAAFVIVLVLIHLIFQDRFHDKILNDVETYGVAFSAMAFACLHGHVPADGRRWRWFAKFMGGVFAGMAINSKEPFVFIVLPLIAVNYIFEEHFSPAERKTGLLFVVAGVSAVFIVLWGYLLCNGALGAYFHILKVCMILARHYAQDVGVFGGGSFPDVVRFSLSKLAAGYQNGLFFIPLVPFYIAFIWGWKGRALVWAGIGGVSLGLYAVSVGHMFWTHYYLMGLIPFMVPAVYGAVFMGRMMKDRGRCIFAVVLLVLAVLLSVYQAWSSMRMQKLRPPVTDDLVVPAGLKAAVDMYTTPSDPLLLMYSPHYYVILDRPHSFVWGQMLDEMLRMYDGIDEADKLARMKAAIEKKMPKVIFLESTYLLPRQQKHLHGIIIPLIREHRYTQVSPGVFVLLPVIKWEDTRGVPQGR